MKSKKNIDNLMDNKNGFLITCICSIVLLLTLCYFGINSSFRGTSAVEASCLGATPNAIIDSASGKVYCCPNGYDKVAEVNGKMYCHNLSDSGYLEYDSTLGKVICNDWAQQKYGLFDALPSGESVCKEELGSQWNVKDRNEGAWCKIPGNTFGCTCSAEKSVCAVEANVQGVSGVASCYTARSVNDDADYYYWGDYSKEEGYTNVSTYTTELSCLSHNISTIVFVKNNGDEDWVNSTYENRVSTTFNEEIEKKIVLTVDSNKNSGLTINNNVNNEYFPKFVGWKLVNKRGNASFAESKEEAFSGSWKSISVGDITTDTSFRYWNVWPGGVTHLVAQWETLQIQLPTIESTNGDKCSLNTRSDGTGDSYEGGDKYTTTSETPTELTLYAICEYTVYYNFNGGVNGPSEASFAVGQPMNVSSVKPTKDGYTFVDWNTQIDGKGTSYSSGGIYPNVNLTSANAITLYAQWEANSYEVVYDGNGSTSGSMSNSAHIYDVAKNLTKNTYVRAGYSFEGWTTNADGSGTSYADSESVKNLTNISNGKITLYAQWEEIPKYTVYYNFNGGVNGPSEASFAVGQPMNVSSVKPTKDGYTFVDWNTQIDGKGTSYLSGGTYPNVNLTSANAITLYAQWEKNDIEAIIPTASNYCKTGLMYNGSNQTLTDVAGTGYTFSNNIAKDAGSYNVTATLNSGYIWKDGTKGTKTFSCSIAKATPTITVSKTALSVDEKSTATFTIKGSVAGDFTITSGSTTKATVSPMKKDDLASNTEQTITVTGVAEGTSTVTVSFTPNDTKNYNNASSKTISVTVINKDIEVIIPTASNYCKTGLVYNGSNQTLTDVAGTGYTFSNNIAKDAGSYNVTATLNSGYIWKDGTKGTKTFSCSIAKATPTITVSKTALSVDEKSTATFTIKGSVAGDFTITSGSTTKATVSPMKKDDLASNIEQTITVTGVAEGTSTVTVSFIPNDTKNYNSVSSASILVTVSKGQEDIAAIIPTASNYCKTGLVYNGLNQTLTDVAGTGYIFSNNIAKDAGSYNVTATLNNGYIWKDGTKGTKTFSCSIAKEESEIEFTTNNIDLLVGEIGSTDYEYVGDGSITCESNNFVSCEVRDEKIYMTAKNVGKTNVTINISEGNNYKSTSKIISVNISKIQDSLAFTATLNSNKGTVDGKDSVSKSCTTTSTSCDITNLPSAIRDGYTFKGWGTKDTCDSGETSKITLDKDTTYYACWVKGVNVDDDGNVEDNVQTGSIVIALVWFFGLFAMGYAFYYFKSVKQN